MMALDMILKHLGFAMLQGVAPATPFEREINDEVTRLREELDRL